MMKMAWTTIVSWTLLIVYNLNSAVATQDFPVKKLCPNSPLKTPFDQIYNNRPAVMLLNGSDSAASVHQIWTEDNLLEFQDCAFIVDSNLYIDSGINRRGLTFSIRKMDLRVDPITGNCIDYLRFIGSGSGKSQKTCSSIDGEGEEGQYSYFLDPVGVVKVHIFVNKSVPLKAPQRSAEIDLIFTAYEYCAGENQIRCDPDDEHFCISDTLKDDGVHNCMWPSNADEPNHPFPVLKKKVLTIDAPPIQPKNRLFLPNRLSFFSDSNDTLTNSIEMCLIDSTTSEETARQIEQLNTTSTQHFCYIPC